MRFGYGRKALAAMLIMLFCFSSLKSDDIFLKNGIKHKRGRILRIVKGDYVFRTSKGKVITIPGRQVARARFTQRKKEKARFHYIPGWPRIIDKDATSNDRLLGYTMLTSFGLFSVLSIYYTLQIPRTSAMQAKKLAEAKDENKENRTEAEHNNIKKEAGNLNSRRNDQILTALGFSIAAVGVYVWHYYDDFELTRVSHYRPAAPCHKYISVLCHSKKRKKERRINMNLQSNTIIIFD